MQRVSQSAETDSNCTGTGRASLGHSGTFGLCRRPPPCPPILRLNRPPTYPSILRLDGTQHSTGKKKDPHEAGQGGVALRGYAPVVKRCPNWPQLIKRATRCVECRLKLSPRFTADPRVFHQPKLTQWRIPQYVINRQSFQVNVIVHSHIRHNSVSFGAYR